MRKKKKLVAIIVMLTMVVLVILGIDFYKKIIKPLDMKMVNNKKIKFVADYSARDNKLVVELDNPVSGNFEYKIDGLEEGYYYISAFATYDGNCDYCFLYGRPYIIDVGGGDYPKTSVPVKEKQQVVVRGIKVKKDGYLVFGSRMSGGDDSKLSIHSFRVNRETNQDSQYNLLLGGALSRLNYVESTGAKFYDFDGSKKDPLDIMEANGINFCRLELNNNPGKGRGDGKYYLPEGFQNQEDILKIAKRAKKHNFEIQLSFMLSDFWTYGIPEDFRKDIEGIKDEEEIVKILEKDLYEYVKDTMQKMKEQDTVPKYVSIGNEMNGGFFLPYGDSSKNMPNLARFINAGYRAVKEVSEDTKVVLHIACNADDVKWNGNGTGNWFFSLCEKNNVNYDVIGTSYYPFWAETLSVDDFTQWCNMMIRKFDKDILLMESGFNYREDTETGSRGQLSNMGYYEGKYDYSEEGQRDFMIELINGIKCVNDGRCVGSLYWDPIMVAGDGIGWSFKEYDDKVDSNVISNTTWFDFDHKALKVFAAYKYN